MIKTYEKPVKKKIKTYIKSFFCSMDLFEAEAMLRSDNGAEKSSAPFGFINFLIILLLIYSFSLEIQNLIEFDSSKLDINLYEDVKIYII